MTGVESIVAFYRRILDAQIPYSQRKQQFVATIAPAIDRWAYRLAPKVGTHIDGVKAFDLVVAYASIITSGEFHAVALRKAMDDDQHLVCIAEPSPMPWRSHDRSRGHRANEDFVEIAVGTPLELSAEISRRTILLFKDTAHLSSARERLAFSKVFASTYASSENDA